MVVCVIRETCRVQRSESRVQHPASRLQRREPIVQRSASRLQRPESRVRSPGSRVQRPESSVQSPASRAQHLESSVQSPASRVQRPTLASRVQEFQYALKKSISIDRRYFYCIFTKNLTSICEKKISAEARIIIHAEQISL